MEVILDVSNSSYPIPEEWIDRWELLSNYREDTRSDEMTVPSSSSLTTEQMSMWILLNEKMDKWLLENERRASAKIEKINLISINRVVQYFMPSSGFYLMLCDFRSFPQSDRIRFLRDLGKWRRDKYMINRVGNYASLALSDPFFRMRGLVMLAYRKSTIKEVLENLVELTEKLPVDILYGLIASGGSIEGEKMYTDEGDWRGILWQDAYDAHLLLQNEWETACVNMLRCYLEHEEELKPLQVTELNFRGVLEPLTLTPSNEIRIFAGKELVALASSYPMSTLSVYHSDADLLREMRTHALLHTIPDLLDYAWTSEATEMVKSVQSRSIRVNLENLPDSVDTAEGVSIKIFASIPDTSAFFNRIYEYVEKHPSWLTYDILFEEVSRDLEESDTLAREEGTMSLFNLLMMVRNIDEYDEIEAEKCATTMASVFGTKCLLAIATCIIGAKEKGYLIDYDYVRASPLFYREVDKYIVRMTDEFLTHFAEAALTIVEREGLTDFIGWPVVVYDRQLEDWSINVPQ